MPRKRTIQKGSIYAYRGKLRIKIRVPDETDASGNPRYLVKSTGLADTGRGRSLAEEMLERIYLELYHGHQTANATSRAPMMSDHFETFMRSKGRMAKTEMNYRLAYKRIVRGNYPVSSARIEEDIKHFVDTAGLSQVSINTYLRQFRAFLSWLHDEHELKVPKNVMKRHGKKTHTIVRYFTDLEVDKMLSDKVDPELTDMLLLMVETGARPVDVLTLTWDQVDLQAGMITWLNKISKREEPRPVSKTVLSMLQIRRVDIADRSRKVFRWSHASLSPVTKQFKALCDRVGVDHDGRTLKHLRTTFKRRLMEKGLPFEVQMYLMRHSTPDVTLGNYSSIDSQSIFALIDNK